MASDTYDLLTWEAWEIPAEASRPSSLRITSDAVFPFATTALLKVYLSDEGLEFYDEESDVLVVLSPVPGPAVIALYEEARRFLMPVVLTEVDFQNNGQRTWLALPRTRLS